MIADSWKVLLTWLWVVTALGANVFSKQHSMNTAGTK